MDRLHYHHAEIITVYKNMDILRLRLGSQWVVDFYVTHILEVFVKFI